MGDRRPAEVFHPGEHLLDELEARGWTQTEFAEIIGRPLRLVNEIINGKRGITPETAREFAAALGTSAEFWMNLDFSLPSVEGARGCFSNRASGQNAKPVSRSRYGPSRADSSLRGCSGNGKSIAQIL